MLEGSGLQRKFYNYFTNCDCVETELMQFLDNFSHPTEGNTTRQRIYRTGILIIGCYTYKSGTRWGKTFICVSHDGTSTKNTTEKDVRVLAPVEFSWAPKKSNGDMEVEGESNKVMMILTSEACCKRLCLFTCIDYV